MEGPEVHTPHAQHHRGLPRWLELLIALTALVTSVSSIVIALHHGKTMEKLVQANSIPYLEGGTGNATPEGDLRITMTLRNQGVGPANQQSLRLKVGDRYVTSLNEVARLVYGPKEAKAALAALRFFSIDTDTRFIPANAEQIVFRTPRTEQNARYWDALDRSRRTWRVEFCYCSVFDECWEVDETSRREVKMCHRDPAREFKPF